MQWIVRRTLNGVMKGFVGSGLSIDERGRLCLPDGLTPCRVHRFIELCTAERYDSPREAMHSLFVRIGVSPRIVRLLNAILDDNGDLELGALASKSVVLMTAVPEFQQIPTRFRDFLVVDLDLADRRCGNLEDAVVSARRAAAVRVGCEPTWEAILEMGDAVGELARPWRERVAAGPTPMEAEARLSA
ncbi:MAG: hypothetical protein ACQGVK_24375 [Myxococcota bacterium]